ncbi:MAG: hypothetical protein SGPRY_009715 [Prymnesium sp.]
MRAERWRDACSTVLAFILPSAVLCGRHSIRPGSDETLLSAPGVASLAPLLSPVLPLHIPDNARTMQMHGEARQRAAIGLMVAVLSAKLAGGRTVIALDDVHW